MTHTETITTAKALLDAIERHQQGKSCPTWAADTLSGLLPDEYADAVRGRARALGLPCDGTLTLQLTHALGRAAYALTR